MKPIPTLLSNDVHDSEVFVAKEIRLSRFSDEFHFHEECQLVYIVKSAGKRIIGDLVDYFESGELIFLGSNIPHVWHNTHEISQHETDEYAHSVALYFNPSKLLQHLSAFFNVNRLSVFLKQAQRGIKFNDAYKHEIVTLLYSMLQQEGISKMITFLQLITTMTDSQYELLASKNYINQFLYQDSVRMNRVFKYIFDNFRQEITLDVIAGVAMMNTSAFCRYFKTHTKKTFTGFVNETRIIHACKLLSNKDSSITGVAFECGFNNVSNFNRFFKELKKMSPREYRKHLVVYE